MPRGAYAESVDKDAIEQMRQKVAQMSPDELKSAVASILGGGLADLVDARHTPPLPTVPDAPAVPCALTVRTDIDETSPPVWRRLVLRGDLTLDRVHEVIQTAFGWADSHLHRFWPGPDKQLWRGPYFLTRYDVDEGEEGILEVDVRLDQVLRDPGDRLFYTYDFGDDWTHTMRLESVDPLADTAPPAVCTAGRRAGPLEDSGGPPGHNELVAAHRTDPSLAGLEDYLRDWVPAGWDPAEFDAEEVTRQLSVVGLAPEEVLASLAGDEGVDWPVSLEGLLGLAPPAVTTQLAQLCARARTEHEAELTAEDLTAITKPYRYLVELAGDDGIPLTGAGWMKPSHVEQIYRELEFDAEWIGKGNREDQTMPIAQLRAMCQQLGLLRKHKERLLQTRLARSLSSDDDYLTAIASRLLHDKHPYQRATLALFAMFTAATGKAVSDHVDPVAELLTACGLRTGPHGVDRRDVLENVRPLWCTLRSATGRTFRDRDDPLPGDHRAVALARAALWPHPPTTS